MHFLNRFCTLAATDMLLIVCACACVRARARACVGVILAIRSYALNV